MMTVKQKLENALVNKGLFPNDAQQIIEKAIPELKKETGVNAVKFNDPADSYPAPLIAVIQQMLKPYALKWIDENCPNAWYRGEFV